jgi:helix-turn-helix protein
MTVLSMSNQEFSRLDVLLRVQSGRLRVADACALMGLHRRQVFRLLRGLKQDGAPSSKAREQARAIATGTLGRVGTVPAKAVCMSPAFQSGPCRTPPGSESPSQP